MIIEIKKIGINHCKRSNLIGRERTPESGGGGACPSKTASLGPKMAKRANYRYWRLQKFEISKLLKNFLKQSFFLKIWNSQNPSYPLLILLCCIMISKIFLGLAWCIYSLKFFTLFKNVCCRCHYIFQSNQAFSWK